MSKRAFSRAYDMPTIDPDKEDEHEAYEGVEFVAPKEDEISRKECAGEFIREYFAEISGKACPVIEASKCSHKWTSYTGLSEQFVFCEICDKRK